MSTTHSSISEEWEHVEDSDTFSVVSLPWSEDDALDPARPKPTIPASRSSVDTRIVVPLEDQFDGLTLNDTTPDELDIDSVKFRLERDAAKAQTIGTANEHVEFDAMCNTIDSLVKLVAEMLSDSHFMTGEMKAECTAVASHLNHLQDIMGAYANHRELWRKFIELPVGMSNWLGTLELELLSIHYSTKGSKAQDSSSVMSETTQANSHSGSLKSLCDTMDGLMVVIQSDYQNFHMLHMPIMTAPEPDSITVQGGAPGRPASHISRGNSNLAHLRRELYTLKDQIVACLNEIRDCQHHGISSDPDQRGHMASLVLSYEKIRDVLGMMLSNHGCDWIDYSIGGGLTYPEFCRLNPDTIRSLILQLKEVTDDLFLERSKLVSCHYLDDPDGRRGMKEMVVSESSLATLHAIEEVLVSILRAR